MSRLMRRMARARSDDGFSLVELMMASVVLVVGLIALAQFFGSSASRVLDSDIRSVLHQVAAEEMETIRGLPYQSVGVQGGVVPGVLLASDTRVVSGMTVKVQRSVRYQTDPTYQGPYYANYRRVTVIVTAQDAGGQAKPGIEPVSLTSYVAGGATGGAILVKVQDSLGAPVEGALFTIVNTVKGVNFNAGDQLTDQTGSMLVPGLAVDSGGNYVVTVSKYGYSGDSGTGFPVLEAGLQEVVLTIDRVSSMHIRVVDQVTGLDLQGISVSIGGPKDYSNTVVTGASGATLSNLRFSTEADPYIVAVPAGQGYLPQQMSVILRPDTVNQEVVITVVPLSATTTTIAATTTTIVGTTTTIVGTTTTGVGTGSLKVTVLNDHGHKLNSQAVVQLGTQSKSNKNNVVLFEYLQRIQYELVVTASGYQSYEQTVTITGADSVTVYLNHD
jgi:prepilin-type N-terminal cleavage/methylation domain-containing protein